MLPPEPYFDSFPAVAEQSSLDVVYLKPHPESSQLHAEQLNTKVLHLESYHPHVG
jgi:hypothetical protein